MVIVFYNGNYDPIAYILESAFYNQKIKDPLFFMTPKELLEEIEIFDEINSDNVQISWSTRRNILIKNDKNTLLINRFSGLDNRIFEGFHPEDISYAYEEFAAYLNFALSNFRTLGQKPSHLGTLGKRYPLPATWEIVKKYLPEFEVPRYYCGDKNFYNIKQFEVDKIINSSIYNYLNWKVVDYYSIKALTESTDWYDLFVFERPKGIPFIFMKFYEEVIYFPLGDTFTKISSLCSKVINDCLIHRVNSIFEYNISECLLFIDEIGNKISFGMINPDLLSLTRERLAKDSELYLKIENALFSSIANECKA